MPADDLAARLLVALEGRDDVALASVLNSDVRMLIDTGDETGAELRGRARVIRVLRQRMASHPDAALHAVQVNGAPGLALRRHDGEVIGVLSIDATESIDELWLSIAPRKLAHWNRRRPDSS